MRLDEPFDLTGTEIEPSDIGDKYRALFKSPMGREVFADMLKMMHFGVTLNPANQAMIAEYNAGLTIMAKAGILDDVKSMLGLRDSAQ